MDVPKPLVASPAARRTAAWEELKLRPEPALLVDARQCILLDANGAAARLWAGPAPKLDIPCALDAAMPAMREMRDSVASAAEAPRSLVFWTRRGAVRLLCRLAVVGSNPDVLAVCVMEAPVQLADDPGSSPRAADHARLAHELRTPIGAVVAYSEVLAGEHFGPIGNDRYREYAANVRQSAMHALGVVEDMLTNAGDGSRAKRELRFRDLDPGQMIASCMTVMRPIALKAGVSLEGNVPVGLPRIVADDVSLRQMLLNLLTNAIKFARRGDRVFLGVTYDGDGSLTFAVDDTGPGIEATKALDDGAASKGLGLGLPLTRELAEANGAALAIESAPGHGTRARISFSHTRVVPV